MRPIGPFFFILFAFAGCAHAPAKTTGVSEVDVAYSMTAADVLKYESVGTFTSRGMLTEEDCIVDIKNQAAGSGANLIRITSTEHDYCGLEPSPRVQERTCITVRATGYRRKPFAEE